MGGDIDPVWTQNKDILDTLEAYMAHGVTSDVPLIQQVAHHVLCSGGKRIRPLLFILSAQLCGERENPLMPVGGSMIEYIHTATLLHDDVLDGSETRRGVSSARTLWGNAACILVGDYLYTLAACQAAAMNHPAVTLLFAETCKEMSEGETLQLMCNNKLDLEESTYLRIIHHKTASLFAACGQLGGIIAGASEEDQAVLTSFGRDIGLAFQIVDDTLDYIADKTQTGKPAGKDFQEGRITLPLLHLLRCCTSRDRARIKEYQPSSHSPETLFEGLHEVRDMMDQQGSITYAFNQARGYAERAQGNLSLRFKDSAPRQAMLAMANDVVNRNH